MAKPLTKDKEHRKKTRHMFRVSAALIDYRDIGRGGNHISGTELNPDHIHT